MLPQNKIRVVCLISIIFDEKSHILYSFTPITMTSPTENRSIILVVLISIIASEVKIVCLAESSLETQTNPNYDPVSVSLEEDVFLPTLSSDDISITKFTQMIQKKRFRPRILRSTTTTSTTPVSTTPTNIKSMENSSENEIATEEVTESSITSQGSALAKRNFFRRRRKPTIKDTLRTSGEDTTNSSETITDKSKNETAVDIIMQKIKKAQRFKSGRKFFHDSSVSRKNRKRMIKGRTRFRPPLTTDKTIPNTSTAPILATNEKLMRIAANRRKKHMQDNLLINKSKEAKDETFKGKTDTGVKVGNTTIKRNPISRRDWSKKTVRPSLVGAKLKAMRDRRKNKYKKLKSEDSSNDPSQENSSDNEETVKPSTFDIVTEPSHSHEENAANGKIIHPKIRQNKYSRVVIQRPIKKPSSKRIASLGELPESSSIASNAAQDTDVTEIQRETTLDTLLDENETTTLPYVDSAEFGDVRHYNLQKMKKYNKKPNKIIMPNIYRFKQKQQEVELDKGQGYELTTIGKWRKNKVKSRSSPANVFIATTDEPEDLTISATTNRLHDETSSSLSKVTAHAEENDGAARTDLEPDVEPESTKPDSQSPTQPKLDWSKRNKDRSLPFQSSTRKNILKGNFIRIEDSQFAGSENEESIAENYDELYVTEDESAVPENSDIGLGLKTLLDIDTFGVTQRNVAIDADKNITPKIKRKIITSNSNSEETLMDKINRLRNDAISGTLERYSEESLGSVETGTLKTATNNKFKEHFNDKETKIHQRNEAGLQDNDNDHQKTYISVSELQAQERIKHHTSIGIDGLASLINLPSSFDSINDEDNFIFTDIEPHHKEKYKHVQTSNVKNIDRRQDATKVNLVDIVESEITGNDGDVTEELDQTIITGLEGILDIHIPSDSRIRRSNSRNRIIRRQNKLNPRIIPSEDFVDVLPNGTSLVRHSIIFSIFKSIPYVQS